MNVMRTGLNVGEDWFESYVQYENSMSSNGDNPQTLTIYIFKEELLC